MTIRPARHDDLEALRAIELAAGAPFRDLGMAAIADAAAPPVAELAVFQRDGRAWVVTSAAGSPVGYLLVDIVDGNAHIEQVSVDPSHGRQGLGRKLLDAADEWAQERGLTALTLSTFAEVPWNGPYYERLGFRVVPESEVTPGLAAIRAAEAAQGLAAWPRVTMRRDVASRGLGARWPTE
ncbi:MAG: GNAT family N-acetyltransferase [Actinomycetota bacterium]|nr:GNAT family N-acetyltransferase [Actinomycetota bacterium]